MVEGESDGIRSKGNLLVKGSKTNNVYRGLEETLNHVLGVIKEGEGVVLLMQHHLTALTKPITKDTKSRNLLEAIERIVEKTGTKMGLVFSKREKPASGTARNQTVTLGDFWSLVDPADVRNITVAWGMERWQERWASTDAYIQTKLWYPTLREDFVPFMRSLNREELGKAIQYLTGHNSLRRHLVKIKGPEPDSDCRLCGEEEEDATHLWTRCPAMTDLGWEGPTDSRSQPHHRPFFRGERANIWTPQQLSRFLTRPPIALLLRPGGEE